MTTSDARSASLDQIGGWLRLAFAAVVAAPLPDKLQALVDQLGDGSGSPGGRDARFRAELAAAIPHLRGYGRSLCGSADLADDLVQETMLKAWLARDRFVAGSSMRAWTHVILRNAYFTIARRTRFRGEWDEHAADLLLAVPAAQDHRVALGDLQRALMQLPPPQREALIMMGASGMSCEEVAEISQCAVGTVKSRVARARTALRRLIDDGQLDVPRAAVADNRLSPLDQIMLQAQQLASAR
jgi:RNA polymerase sigma-70 factor, ECF subfamily